MKTTGNLEVLDKAFLTTVIALGQKIGYKNEDQVYQPYVPNPEENIWQMVMPIIILLGIVGIFFYLGIKYRGRGFGPGGLGRGGLGGGGFGWGGLLGSGLGWAVAAAAEAVQVAVTREDNQSTIIPVRK